MVGKCVQCAQCVAYDWGHRLQMSSIFFEFATQSHLNLVKLSWMIYFNWVLSNEKWVALRKGVENNSKSY